MENEARTANRLINEKSPYLLQHAHNPVDWFPWCEEAFKKAEAEDRPVFLSIGYSTCHWCHVMERESFEDSEIAEVLNGNFVSVKVDREERPDIDSIYMSVCQLMTGAGGWPLTIFMTPGKKPFFAATYLPRTGEQGGIGLLELLKAVSHQWAEDKNSLIEAGNDIADHIRKMAEKTRATELSPEELIERAVCGYAETFDENWGGFGRAPKFPMAHNLIFLLRHYEQYGDEKSLEMAVATLERMYRGGLFDHLGGGFSRYSTDERWGIPHFEKMLYDNALLALAYAEAYRITGRELFKNVTERTLDYVLRELADPRGGFYCGQDSGSGGEEGKFYFFTAKEIEGALGEEDGRLFCRWFGIAGDGRHIPTLMQNTSFNEENSYINLLAGRLFKYRQSRNVLHKDDKVLTSWNGLMIIALSRASKILGRPDYLEAAKRASAFISENLEESDRLYARWREGQRAIPGLLCDYAFYIEALLELYETEFDPECVTAASALADVMLELFADRDSGGFFMSSSESESLIARPKETYDGAMPSGNSAAAAALFRLAALTGEPRFLSASRSQTAFISGEIEFYPSGHGYALLTLLRDVRPSMELVCVTNRGIPEAVRRLLSDCPSGVSILLKTADNAGALSKCAPFTREYPIPDRGEMYYLCKNGSCMRPTDDLLSIRDEIYGKKEGSVNK